MKKTLFSISCLAILILSACKKEINETVVTTPTTPTTPTTASQIDLLKDSVYLYSKEVYLWEELIPSYDQFNPRQYAGTTLLEAGSAVMNGIRKLQPLDRFSFVTSKESSAGLQSGENVSLGFFIKAAAADRVDPIDSVRWYVSYVYDKSTSGSAGVKRGWYINKIDGTTINYDQASVKVLNEVFFGGTKTASFEFVKPDGSVVTSNLTKTSFVSNSVLHQSVIPVAAKKVGYLVFNQFFGEPSRVELTNAFNSFKAAGINDLVVDLRYNPGGSTQTQDALADLIAPASATNQVMYKYVFNKNLQNGNFPLLKRKSGFANTSFSETNNTQKFTTTGGLGLTRVFIIVSKSSASASELLINNLKPYMDVKLIGDSTYGKPVGFFPIDIFNLSIYPISFKTVNSVGNADFYNGFGPDKKSPDGVMFDWGNTAEPSLASALKYVQTGSFRASAAQAQLEERSLRTQQQLEPLFIKLDQKRFSGMFVENKK